MTMLELGSISQRSVDALPAGKDTVFWDRELAGFGVRVYPSGARVYIVQCRGPAGPRRITLGRHGVIAAEEARRRAALIIGRIRAGEDARPLARTVAGPTVAALAARYLREHVAVRCKPATVAQYRLAIDAYILPALGALPVASIGRTHVADLHHGLCDRPAMANVVVATLSRMIEQAVAWGLVPEGSNPCRHTQRYRMRPRERFLTDAELRRLGAALTALEAEGRLPLHAAAALRLLILTGCRRNEIVSLRWEDVRLEDAEIRLRDSKTGPRTVSLSPAAVALLAALPRLAGNPWVIPGCRPGARMTNIYGHWRRVRTRAELEDVRIHDLRHSYASRALALGESLPVIAKLLGHARIQSTARYAHLTRDSVREAAARVAAGIGADILPPRRHPATPVRRPPRRPPGQPTTRGLRGMPSRHRRPASPPRSGRTSCRRASAIPRLCRPGPAPCRATAGAPRGRSRPQPAGNRAAPPPARTCGPQGSRSGDA